MTTGTLLPLPPPQARQSLAQCLYLVIKFSPLFIDFIFLSFLTDPSLGLMAWNHISWEEFPRNFVQHRGH